MAFERHTDGSSESSSQAPAEHVFFDPETRNTIESRRNFLKTTAGLLFVGGAFAGRAEAQNVNGVPPPNIETLKDGSFYFGPWEVEKNGKGRRGPSEFPPAAYKRVPVHLDRTFTLKPADAGRIVEVQYMIPLQRDIGEVSRDATIVKKTITGFKGDPKIEVQLITSQPNDNQYFYIRCEGETEAKKAGEPAAKDIEFHIELISLMTVPVESPVGPTRSIITLKNEEAHIRAAIAFNDNVRNLNTANTAIVGDGGIQATRASNESGGVIEPVFGWAPSDIPLATHGGHAWVHAPGNLVCDPSQGYTGSETEFLIPGTVGSEFRFKDNPLGKMMERQWQQTGNRTGLNGGVQAYYFKGTNGTCNDPVKEAEFSYPGVGKYGNYLLQLMQKPPQEWRAKFGLAARHSKQFTGQRKRINRR